MAGKVDNYGNLYVVGHVWIAAQPLFCISNPTSPQPEFDGGDYARFIVKYGTDRNLVWGSYYGGTESNYIEVVAISNDNEPHVIDLPVANRTLPQRRYSNLS